MCITLVIPPNVFNIFLCHDLSYYSHITITHPYESLLSPFDKPFLLMEKLNKILLKPSEITYVVKNKIKYTILLLSL